MLHSGVPSLANIRFSPYALPNMSNSSGYPISTPSVGWAPDPTLQYSVANSILPNSTSAIQSSITSPSSSSISNPSSQSLNNNMAATLALAGAIPGLEKDTTWTILWSWGTWRLWTGPRPGIMDRGCLHYSDQSRVIIYPLKPYMKECLL